MNVDLIKSFSTFVGNLLVVFSHYGDRRPRKDVLPKRLFCKPDLKWFVSSPYAKHLEKRKKPVSVIIVCLSFKKTINICFSQKKRTHYMTNTRPLKNQTTQIQKKKNEKNEEPPSPHEHWLHKWQRAPQNVRATLAR